LPAGMAQYCVLASGWAAEVQKKTQKIFRERQFFRNP
jgi:hypothetical protein